jgi:hypothetical protein
MSTGYIVEYMGVWEMIDNPILNPLNSAGLKMRVPAMGLWAVTNILCDKSAVMHKKAIILCIKI